MSLLLASLIFAQAGSTLPSGCTAGDPICDPWARFRLKSETEKVGPGPYVLIISEVNGGMTKIRYRNGAACVRARDVAKQQNRGVRLQALCVPI